MPLILILTEAGVELIPKKIRNHPIIKKQTKSKNFASQLLDNALHHVAMKKLDNLNKRGRPDIAHACLLNALGSPSCKTNNLEIYLHTINNRIFKFNPEIRIARNYNRFKGLMAKLLIEGNITINGTKLISEVEISLKQLIQSYKNPITMLFSKKGKLIENQLSLFEKSLTKNYIALVGCFQKDSFNKTIFNLTNNIISISRFSLDAWIVVSKVINIYEIINNII